jgi:uncharacterized protein YjiS (DUF1127 family)
MAFTASYPSSGHSSRHAAPLARLLSTLASAVVRYWTSRQVASRLGALSDHELADIGLARGDVSGLSPTFFGEDPTRVLAQRVAGRRQG